MFVADGYVNRRVIVLDADTGKFKRMWGAYGNTPDDNGAEQARGRRSRTAAVQYSFTACRYPTTGLVYVADRMNNRMQVFTIDGKFQREIFVERKTKLLGTSFSVAFSPDARAAVPVSRRRRQRPTCTSTIGKTLKRSAAFGRIGHYAGEFVFLHNVAVDSKGNVYTAEVGNGRRVQKFLRK